MTKKNKIESKAGKGGRTSALGRAASEATPAEARYPMFPEEGSYTAKFLGARQSSNVGTGDWCAVEFECTGKNKSLKKRTILFSTGTKSLAMTAPRVKSLAMALLGVTDKDEYNEVDPSGHFIDALTGVEDPKPKMLKLAEKQIGKEITVEISRGKERDDGDWYRNATFSPLEVEEADEDEDEDEAPAKKGK